MNRLNNPFTPGAGALPPELAGRAQVIEDGRVLSGRVLRGRYEKSLLLIGLRGVGKTVLLKHLSETARHDGVIPVLVEVRNARSDIEELALRLKEALSLIDFASKVKSSVNYAFSVLKNFIKAFSINLGEFGISVEMQPSAASSGNMELDLSEVLLACARAAQDSSTALGLYIDEFQNLDIEATRGIIVALHRAAQDNLPLYLVGSGLPSIRALVGKSKTYAERMFNYAAIGALEEADVDAAITIPLNGSGLNVEARAIQTVYEYTKGYPYFLQEFGYQIWIEMEAGTVTAEDIRRFAPAVELRLDANFFDVRFDRVSNAERVMLRHMAEFPEGEPISTAELSERMGRSATAISPMRASLIRKGMIYSPSHGTIAYTVPLFGDYLKRVMPTI